MEKDSSKAPDVTNLYLFWWIIHMEQIWKHMNGQKQLYAGLSQGLSDKAEHSKRKEDPAKNRKRERQGHTQQRL